MWDRQTLKNRGKIAFYDNYWYCVLVGLICSVISGSLGSTASNAAKRAGENSGNEHAIWLAVFVAGAAVSLSVIGLIVRIFAFYPLEAGCNRFFMENRESKPDFEPVLYGFKSGHYGNVVKIMFLRALYTFLWSLLFLIPGIIKYYQYIMVPYILSENPGMESEKAFAMSKRMTDGHKMDIFILDLSFLGWILLSACTCGILYIFYVQPYMQATYAELYAHMRLQTFHDSSVTTADLPGFGTTTY